MTEKRLEEDPFKEFPKIGYGPQGWECYQKELIDEWREKWEPQIRDALEKAGRVEKALSFCDILEKEPLFPLTPNPLDSIYIRMVVKKEIAEELRRILSPKKEGEP